MTALRSISIEAPGVETLELLVENVTVAELALASTPRLDGIVGDWGVFRSVDAAVETSTYHTLDGFAAMDFGLVLRPATGMPRLVTVTVTASVIGGTVRIITVDRAPPARKDLQEPTIGVEDFVGTFDGYVVEDLFRATSPAAHKHLSGFGLGWGGMHSLTITTTAEALAESFEYQPGIVGRTDHYTFPAEVDMTFLQARGGTVGTDFDALVTVRPDGDVLHLIAMEFMTPEAAHPLGSPTNPIPVEPIVEHAPEVAEVLGHIVALKQDDMVDLASPMLDFAVGAFDRHGAKWVGASDARITPLAETIVDDGLIVEIDGVLRCRGPISDETEHQVVLRLRREKAGLRMLAISLRNDEPAAGQAAATTVAYRHVADVGAEAEAFVESIERLDQTSLWPFSSTDIDLAIGQWSEVERARIVVDCGTLVLDGAGARIGGMLSVRTGSCDRIERLVTIEVDTIADPRSPPRIDFAG